MLFKLKILYEDNHLIAVLKPAGMLVQGDASGVDSLIEAVKKYLQEKYKKPGNIFLGLVHRLDRNVSGIVLFAKTSKGAARLSEQFRNHKIKKTYTALVEGKIKKPSATLKHFLVKDSIRKRGVVFDRSRPRAQEAILSYKTLKTEENTTLIEIQLKTGRFHQIRAQLAYIGHPIVGDRKYGAKMLVAQNTIVLAATGLEFETATDPKRIKLINPADFATSKR